MIINFKKFFGIKPAADYNQLMKDGGMIVDVRTKAEFAGGHINGSKNIPLQILNGNSNLPKDKNRPVITCCASGMRSASAKKFLKSEGFTNVHNGGSWSSLNNKIS